MWHISGDNLAILLKVAKKKINDSLKQYSRVKVNLELIWQYIGQHRVRNDWKRNFAARPTVGCIY
jgi:hypothetical protein